MIKVWTDEAWDDYMYWYTHDKKITVRIHKLIKSIDRDAFDGIGKPEPLKYNYQGFWSVRIDAVNRLVYKVEKGSLYIVSCRYHYD